MQVREKKIKKRKEDGQSLNKITSQHAGRDRCESAFNFVPSQDQAVRVS
jgi:hypothetical protein